MTLPGCCTYWSMWETSFVLSFWTWKFKGWESSFDWELLFDALVVCAFWVVDWLFCAFEFWLSTVLDGLDWSCWVDWFVLVLVWSRVVEFWVAWLSLFSAAWASWCAPITSAEPNVIEATPNLSFLIEKKLFEMSVFFLCWCFMLLTTPM